MRWLGWSLQWRIHSLPPPPPPFPGPPPRIRGPGTCVKSDCQSPSWFQFLIGRHCTMPRCVTMKALDAGNGRANGNQTTPKKPNPQIHAASNILHCFWKRNWKQWRAQFFIKSRAFQCLFYIKSLRASPNFSISFSSQLRTWPKNCLEMISSGSPPQGVLSPSLFSISIWKLVFGGNSLATPACKTMSNRMGFADFWNALQNVTARVFWFSGDSKQSGPRNLIIPSPSPLHSCFLPITSSTIINKTNQL